MVCLLYIKTILNTFRLLPPQEYCLVTLKLLWMEKYRLMGLVYLTTNH